jgi:hypothetical protein
MEKKNGGPHTSGPAIDHDVAVHLNLAAFKILEHGRIPLIFFKKLDSAWRY